METRKLQTMAEAVLGPAAPPAGGDGEPVRHVWLYDDQGEVSRKSHVQLCDDALRWAGWFRRAGIRQGEIVFIGLPTGWDYIGALLGCIVSGIHPCTVPLGCEREISGGALHNTLGAFKSISPRLYVTTEQTRAQVCAEQAMPAETLVHVPAAQREIALSPEELPTLRPTDVHHLQLTSGSTATPKAAVLTREAVLVNIAAVVDALRVNPATDSGCCWLPMFHDMGLMQLLMVMCIRGEFVLQSPGSFLRNPIRWLERVHEHRITMAAAPAFAYTYCVRRYRADIASRLDLSCWRVAGVGAERVEHRVLREFHDRYRAHGFCASRFFNCYGMAEAGFAVSVPRRAYSTADSEVVPAAGRPVAGMEICVRDGQGRERPEGEAGELCIRGSSLMHGYYGQVGSDAARADGKWFPTGDIGYYKRGELYIIGRIKDVVILRGRNYLPQEFEECVAEVPEVEMHRAAAFGVYEERSGSESLVVVVEPRIRCELRALHASLQRRLRDRFGFGAADIVFVAYGAIPRTTSHKVQRARCRELYLRGELEAVGNTGHADHRPRLEASRDPSYGQNVTRDRS